MILYLVVFTLTGFAFLLLQDLLFEIRLFISADKHSSWADQAWHMFKH